MCELNDAYDTFIPNYQKVNGKKYGKISATFTVSRGENPNHREKDNIIKDVLKKIDNTSQIKIAVIIGPEGRNK